MDTQKKTFHCKTTTEQELTGKKILQNCRNQLYLDFPYLDGAFASLESVSYTHLTLPTT